ncbi:MAG TPA: methionine synthase, partial [Gammaproteobacteria bacterium]|nr:methionine synthase [Gammaproteobacteria bacterium]
TVKGDVHDIGKNIVGVVLQCNNFEVIDLGVMVSCETILQQAREHEVDVIGLSGLITPSLEEMAHIAREMEREGMKIPLIIGGATTSKAHTAVKIDPGYSGPVVWVKDASRAVGVVQSLISEDLKGEFVSALKEEYRQVREQHAGRSAQTRWLTLEQARANRERVDWQRYQPPAPQQKGIHRFDDFDLEKIVRYIDWTPFFHAWELRGSYPKILQDSEQGEEARKLFSDAQQMLQRIVGEKWLRASAVAAILPANTVGHDDVEIYADESRDRSIATFHFLRQQRERAAGQANLCLADFIAPKESGKADWLGLFAVTAGHGVSARVAQFEAAHDDYNAILLKALADRLAEAFAELLHEKIRREIWGYAPDERLDNDALIEERYRGIRPAPGYPACPEHTEKGILWELLGVEKSSGISLTEHFAMRPAASVSGFCFSHPQARYFTVGKITREQVQEYARRKGISLAEAERWLAPNLGYTPE